MGYYAVINVNSRHVCGRRISPITDVMSLTLFVRRLQPPRCCV